MNSFWRETECTVCNRRFTVTHSCNLVNHSRIHSGEKPYKCHECEKVFSQSGYLNTHMIVHTEDKLLKCLQCGGSVRQSLRLQFRFKLEFVSVAMTFRCLSHVWHEIQRHTKGVRNLPVYLCTGGCYDVTTTGQRVPLSNQPPMSRLSESLLDVQQRKHTGCWCHASYQVWTWHLLSRLEEAKLYVPSVPWWVRFVVWIYSGFVQVWQLWGMSCNILWGFFQTGQDNWPKPYTEYICFWHKMLLS